ncbi:MAG TPA: hypothetical protein VHT05_05775 [Candidatus Elarobacter sp.]|jgi:hypothetical protein|nr:hypothetical protein [Candidatus Elarobacter sp.]
MARLKGSGKLGPTRSTRLPAPIDAWLESRLMLDPARSVSEILLQLVHGGLRLREGYMSIHRRALESHQAGDPVAYAAYRACLVDSFGSPYLEHLDRWLEADGIVPARASSAVADGLHPALANAAP